MATGNGVAQEMGQVLSSTPIIQQVGTAIISTPIER
jgi:hypothetical protein